MRHRGLIERIYPAFKYRFEPVRLSLNYSHLPQGS